MPFVAYSPGSVYLPEKPSLPDFIRAYRSPAGIGEVWVETYGAAVPDGHRTTTCGCDVIGARPDWSTHKTWPNGFCASPPQSDYRADEARTDRTGLCRLIAHRRPDLPNLCACWSAVTRSRNIPLNARSAETPPHLKRPRRYEVSWSISSQGREGRRRKLVSETTNPQGARSSNDLSGFLSSFQHP